MFRLFSTKHHSDWWTGRQINWATDYLSTWDHPHRKYLLSKLRELSFRSVFEIGSGPGANLLQITKHLPGVAVGGCDVNPEAIKLAQETFGPSSLFVVSSADELMMSDQSCDLGLSDMTLIYVDPLHIKKYLKELVRISRRNIVLVEFYHPSFWKRLKMTLAGRYTHNYPSLLESLGCVDIQTHKMPSVLWPGAKDNDYRYLIMAKT